jgi:hypothetical protein
VNHGDTQHGGTIGWGKGHFNNDLRSLTASRGNPHRCVTGLSESSKACASRNAAENLLPVVVPVQAVAAQAIATQGVVYVAALDVVTEKAHSGGDMWVGANGALVDVTTVDEVTSRV